jgi:hypothetical protein
MLHFSVLFCFSLRIGRASDLWNQKAVAHRRIGVLLEKGRDESHGVQGGVSQGLPVDEFQPHVGR